MSDKYLDTLDFKEQVRTILDFNTDEATGGITQELEDYFVTRITERHVKECKKKNLEWRIEQMRRVRTYMAKEDYDRIQAELTDLLATDIKPIDSDANAPTPAPKKPQ